jgi:glutamyl-tRNA reductase
MPHSDDASLIVTDVRVAMDRVRALAVAKAFRQLGPLTPEQRARIEHLSRILMDRFLCEPSARLCAAAGRESGVEILATARYLFGVGDAAMDALYSTGRGNR